MTSKLKMEKLFPSITSSIENLNTSVSILYVCMYVGLPELKSLTLTGDISEAGNTLTFTLITDMVGLCGIRISKYGSST